MGTASPGSPVVLLENLAMILNACDEANIDVKLKHGVVFSKIGYVLPTVDGWIARTLQYTPFSDGDDDEDIG